MFFASSVQLPENEEVVEEIDYELELKKILGNVDVVGLILTLILIANIFKISPISSRNI